MWGSYGNSGGKVCSDMVTNCCLCCTMVRNYCWFVPPWYFSGTQYPWTLQRGTLCYGHRSEAVPLLLLIDIENLSHSGSSSEFGPPSLPPVAPSYTHKAIALLWYPRLIFYRRHFATPKPRGLSLGAHIGPGVTKSRSFSLTLCLSERLLQHNRDHVWGLDQIWSILLPLVVWSKLVYLISLFSRVLLVLACLF